MRTWIATTALLAGCRGGFDADILDGLVAHYAMDDDPNGGRITDDFGSHHGHCDPATCPTATAGHIGGGYHFDGTDVVRISHAADLDLPAAFTISLWIALADPAVKQSIFAKPYGTDITNSWLILAQNGTPCFNTTSGTVIQSQCDTALFAPGWIHVVVLYDRSATAITKALYVAGEKRQVNTITTEVVFDDHDILIGADENATNLEFYMTGELDDIRVYDRALAEPEITDLASR